MNIVTGFGASLALSGKQKSNNKNNWKTKVGTKRGRIPVVDFFVIRSKTRGSAIEASVAASVGQQSLAVQHLQTKKK
jgi:hypothetical protein